MQNYNNPRFQLLINGKVVATAGVETYGVVSGILSWVKRDPAKKPAWADDDPDFDEEEWVEEELDIDLGGFEDSEHITWFEGSLKTGDEVTIRILEAGDTDKPTKTNLYTPVYEAKSHINNLWRGLKTAMVNDPDAIILNNDGRFIVFNNAVITLEEEFDDFHNPFDLDAPSLTVSELFTHVEQLKDIISKLPSK